jgi:hypothetical protein
MKCITAMILLVSFLFISVTGKAEQLHILSVTGRVVANHQLVQEMEILTPRTNGIELRLDPFSALYALANNNLAIGIYGETTIKFDKTLSRFEAQSRSTISLTGNKGTLHLDGWTIELDPSGATLLVNNYQVYIIRGKARIYPPALERFDLIGQVCAFIIPRPLSAYPAQASAGQVATLSLTGQVTIEAGKPDQQLIARTFYVQTPKPWTSPKSRITLDEAVQTAHQVTIEQQKATREGASCGCTEPSGMNTGATNERNTAGATLEKTHGTLKIRIMGLPKRVP